MYFFLLLKPYLFIEMKKYIPNFITSLNIVCGCIGIGMAFKGDLVISAVMIGVSAIFDFLDGMAARLLNIKSEFGKELDSLADVISFGLLPGLIMYCLLNIVFEEAESWMPYIPFIAFLIPIFSALRLAKYNIDTKQTDNFIGMPTPANAIFIASIPLILVYHGAQVPFVGSIFGNPGFLVALIFLLSFLMVSSIPLFSLKFDELSWKKNKMQYILIFSSIVLLVSLSFLAIPIIFFLYILLSVIHNSQKK